MTDLTEVKENDIIQSFQKRRGVEQWQLVGLITRRSEVRILSPLLEDQEKNVIHNRSFFLNPHKVHYIATFLFSPIQVQDRFLKTILQKRN